MIATGYGEKAGWEERVKQRQRKEKEQRETDITEKRMGRKKKRTQAEGFGEGEKISYVRQTQHHSVSSDRLIVPITG